MTGAIGTARLILRPILAGDVARLGTLALGADIAALIADSLAPASLTSCWRMTARAGHDIGLAALRAPSADSLALRAIGWRSREVIVAVQPGWRRKGLATEAIDALATHAAGDGVTFALVAAVRLDDLAAHRLLQSAGFCRLGCTSQMGQTLVVYERAV